MGYVKLICKIIIACRTLIRIHCIFLSILLCSSITQAAQTKINDVGFISCLDNNKLYEIIYDLHNKSITIQWRGSNVVIDNITIMKEYYLLSGILDERNSEYCKKCLHKSACLNRCDSRYLVKLRLGVKNEIIYTKENDQSYYKHECTN